MLCYTHPSTQTQCLYQWMHGSSRSPSFSFDQLEEVFGRHMVFCTNRRPSFSWEYDSRTSQCSDLTIDSTSRIVSISSLTISLPSGLTIRSTSTITPNSSHLQQHHSALESNFNSCSIHNHNNDMFFMHKFSRLNSI